MTDRFPAARNLAAGRTIAPQKAMAAGKMRAGKDRKPVIARAPAGPPNRLQAPDLQEKISSARL
jgi:hypothetical protein